MTYRPAVTAFLLLGTAALLFAQGSADVNAGAALYREHCASCHGNGGNQIASVNLQQGKFIRTALSDDDLIAVIMQGSPGGLMPAVGLDRSESARIVAYMRAEARGGAAKPVAGKAPAALSESALRGKVLFSASGCFTCHAIGDQGSRMAADLTEIALVRSPRQLTQSIVDPDAEILPHNRTWRVVTRDGAVVLGRLLNHDTFRVQMIDSHDRLRSFVKADLREQGFVMRSPMPSYKDKLTAAELNDLVAWLTTLKENE